jgi:hypothetical protein
MDIKNPSARRAGGRCDQTGIDFRIAFSKVCAAGERDDKIMSVRFLKGHKQK